MRRCLLLALVAALLVSAACAGSDVDDQRTGPVRDAGGAGATDAASEPEEHRAVTDGQGAPDAGSGNLPSNLLDRKISYEAGLDLSVEDVVTAARDVERLADQAGGYVAQSQSYTEGDRRVAEMTIRVPADQYRQTLDGLRGLAAEVESERAQARDVTEEYTDLQSRLRNLEAVEAQYVELLGRADEIGEVLQVQDRLNQVRGEIELVKGRIQVLDQLTALATIDVRLVPVPPAVDEAGGGVWEPLRAAERAWEASLRVVSQASEAAIMVAVFSWWLLPLLALAAWFGRRWWRTRPHGAAATDV